MLKYSLVFYIAAAITGIFGYAAATDSVQLNEALRWLSIIFLAIGCLSAAIHYLNALGTKK